MEQLYNAIRTMDQFQKFADDNKEKTIYIVGAGMYGEVLGEGMTLLGVPWAGYVDRRGEGSLNGKEIRPYSYVKGIENIVLLISSWQHADSMAGNIKAEGINAESIYAIMDSKVIDIIALTADVPLKGNYYVSSYGNADPDKTYMIMEKSAPYEGIFCDMCSFMRGFAFAEKNNFLPIIDRKFYPSFLYQNIEHIGRENAWEYFFLQPGGVPLAEVERDKKNIRRYCVDDSSNLKAIGRSLQYSSDMGENELKEWKRIARKYIKLNDTMLLRVNDTYKTLFPGNREDKVLGVSVREGYALAIEMNLKHEVNRRQPQLQEVFEDVERVLRERMYEKVFLVCELQETKEAFEKRFGNRIITTDRKRLTKREYIDNMKKGFSLYRESNAEEKQREYIVDIYLLSKCNSILCGWSSGTSMAVLLKEDEYEYLKFYNYGKVIT